MACLGMSWRGIGAPRFLAQGRRLNSTEYLGVLENAYLMDIADTFRGEDYTFLQDGAPAHTSVAAQKWCQANLSKFRDTKSWPPASPDLTVLDSFAWGWLQKRVSEFNPTNLQTPKIAIRNAVLEMPIEQVRASVDGW